MTSSGRFFPLSIAEGTAVFLVFTDRESYKIFQFVIVGVTLTLSAVLVGTFLKSRWCGFAAFGVSLAALQLKSWYDPYWQFAGQQELVASLALSSTLCAILAVRRRRKWPFFILTVLGTLALVGAATTYESSVFLVGVSFALLIRERGRRSRRLVVGVTYAAAALVVLANLFLLRNHATVTNPAYVISLVPHKVRETLTNQVISAVPGTYGHFTRGSMLPTDPSLPVAPLLAVPIVIAFVVVMAVAARHIMLRSTPNLTWAYAAGAVLWVVPSFFVAISSRWQMEVKPGLGYIPVIFGALAFSWIAILAVATLGRALQQYAPSLTVSSAVPIRALSTLLAVGSACMLLITASSNEAAVRFEPFAALQAQRDGFVAAIESGLFGKQISPNAVIVRPIPDWWYWQNAPFAAWYGAPATLRFATPDEALTFNCGGSDDCFVLNEARQVDGSYSYSLSPFG
jgi:hypothetical protein